MATQAPITLPRMSEAEPNEPKPAAPRRLRKRRILLALAVLLLLGIVFHRPLLSWGVRRAVILAARSENIRVDLQVGGDFLTTLEVRNLRATPTGPTPIDRLEIGRAAFEYNFWKLLRGGVSEFLSSYQLHETFMEFTPVRGTERQKHELANLLRDIVQQPALFSDRVNISNFNLMVNLPEGPMRLMGVNAFLDPLEPGHLRVAEIAVPKIITWKDIEAAATYQGRKLVLRDFHLGHEIEMARVELDSSRRHEGINYLSVEGRVLEGHLGLFLWRRAVKGEDAQIQMTASLRRFPLAKLGELLRWEPQVSGTVEHAWVQMTGDPDDPSSWNGNALLDADAIRIDGIPLESVDGFQMVTNGRAEFKGAISTGANRLAFHTSHQLPETVDELFTTGVTAALELHAPELARLTPVLHKGELTGNGQLKIEKRRLTLDMEAHSTGVEGAYKGEPLTLGSGKARLKTEYAFQPRPKETPWHEGLEADARLSLGALRFGPALLDYGVLHTRVEDGAVLLKTAWLQRGRNEATLVGQMQLPAPGVPLSWKTLEASLEFNAYAPALAELAPEADPKGRKGTLVAKGEVRRSGGRTTGKGDIEAEGLSLRDFNLQRLSVTLPVESETLHIRDLAVNLNAHDRITGNGSVALESPFAYEGRLKADVRNLAIFESLVKKPLGGTLAIEWHGAGQIVPFRNRGEGQLTLKGGRFDAVEGIEAEISGRYSPEVVDLPVFRIRTSKGGLDSVLRLKNERLHLDPLHFTWGKEIDISGSATLPVDLRTPEKADSLLPQDAPLQARLTLRELPIRSIQPPPAPETLRRRKGEPPPGLDGTVAAEFTAAGTLAAPVFDLGLHLRGLRAPGALGPQSAAVDAALRFREDRLSLTGSATLPEASPLQFEGEIPLPLRQIIAERKIDPATPLRLKATLPDTRATVISRFIPRLRYVEGQLALEASATGTLEKPLLNGALRLNLPAIRFRDANLPGINQLKADIRLSENRVTIGQFTGDASGGPFSLGGSVSLADLAAPVLDLRVRTRNTLLLRNDTMVIRADSDIKIAGPLQTAKVSGKVGINRSRFFREIEILPLGLPGRPSPAPSAPPSAPSIEAPPLRDWSFDIAIRTTEPFIIRSNLAAGQVFADLKLGGTGRAPTLEGTARVENFVASLPFSRLEVASGYLYFRPDDPFNPYFDIHGTSRMRDFNIHVYIYGTAADPQTVFTSEPPLPQEEIVTLLATGATTQEVADNSELLAGRAGILLLQDLYHKVFKRRRPPPSGPGNRTALAERFRLDVGSVDPRTGRQQVGGSFTLSRHFEIAAGIDLEGDVRAELRYLIRFR